MQTTIYTVQTTFDALNRPVIITQPNNHAVVNIYNKGGLLEKVQKGHSYYICNIDYNARGQRTKIVYGNGSETTFTYDEENFRLIQLLTTRNTGNDILQNLNYSYDSVGNITQVEDDAQQTIYFNNTVIDPVSTYEYDALYRLVEATGRELTSLQMPTDTDFVNNIPVPNTGSNAMQTYTQQYSYDALGNITQMYSVNQWTRDYIYDTATNRLLRHSGSTNVYTYDAHGNMLSMPHLTSMVWTNRDELMEASNGTVTSYYQYDAQGNRTRKVVVKPGNIREERYYIDGYEMFYKYVGTTTYTKRDTVHVSEERDRFVVIDVLSINNGVLLTKPITTICYQYSNHLGSACLELDSAAAIISYEEYHPFGTTSYRSGRNEVDVSLKRYKYVGKERDEETGLYYYGARYYAAWIGRFVSVDPLQHSYPQLTSYNYAGNKPVTHIDIDGMQSTGDEKRDVLKPEHKILHISENIVTQFFNTDKVLADIGEDLHNAIKIAATDATTNQLDMEMYLSLRHEVERIWNERVILQGFRPKYDELFTKNLNEAKTGEEYLRIQQERNAFVIDFVTRMDLIEDANTILSIGWLCFAMGQNITPMRAPRQLYIPMRYGTTTSTRSTAIELPNSGPIIKSVGAASTSEQLAIKLKLNINSPVTRQVLNSLDQTVDSFITTYRKASIRSVFPEEFLNQTVEQALRSGNTTVRKLLIDGRFVK